MPGARGPRWRPVADDELLVTTALWPDARGAAAWDRLRPRLDLDHLRPDQLALVPAVHHTLEATGTDDPDAPRLAGLRRRAWVRTTQALAAAEPVLGALATAGIPTLLVGGSALVAGGLVPADRRPLAAVAVLVPAHSVPRAVATARDLGLDGPDLDEATTTAGLVAWPGKGDGGARVDLHWLVDVALPVAGTAAVIRATPWAAPPAEEPAWSRARTVQVGSAPTAVPDPADLVLQVALHEVGTGNEDHLRWVLDLAAVVAADPDWDLVVAEATRRRVGRLLGRRLTLAAERFAVPVPPTAVAALTRAADGARARLAAALVGTGPRRRSLARYLLLTAADPVPATLAALPPYRAAARARTGTARGGCLPAPPSS